MKLISFREIYFSFGWLAADNAGACFGGLIEGDVAGGGFGIFLHLGFTLARFTPVGERPSIGDNFLQVFVVFGFMDICIAELCGALEE